MASLDEERRQRVEERIVEAATDVLFRDGPSATVDAVAAEAGVGRATVFRYFPQRDELLAAGLRRAYAGFEASIEPLGDRDADEWLQDVVAAAVVRGLRSGTGYLRTLLDPGDGALADVVRGRLELRAALNARLADDIWRGFGGARRPPKRLVDTVALLTGHHAIHALHVDAGLDQAAIIDHITWQLRSLVAELVG